MCCRLTQVRPSGRALPHTSVVGCWQGPVVLIPWNTAQLAGQPMQAAAGRDGATGIGGARGAGGDGLGAGGGMGLLQLAVLPEMV